MNHSIRSLFSLSLLLIAGLLLCGCAPEVLPSSGAHPPTQPGQVKFYPKQPAKYEQLGTVTILVTPEMKWDEKGDSTPGFEALRAKAAAMGANGLLFAAQPGTFDMLVTAGYKDQFYQVAVRKEPKSAIAQAIWVVKE